MLKKIRYLFYYIWNSFILRYREVSFGKNLKINGKIYIFSDRTSRVVLGDNVRINSSLSSNPIGGNEKTILVANDGGLIEIGANVGISNSVIVAKQSVVIEKNVYVGGNTKIYDTDFHWIDMKERLEKSGGVCKPVHICEGAFIGAHCIILKGVTVGKGAVIGAGSVVTKNVPENQVWAGNPAKYIKNIKADYHENTMVM